MNLPTMSVSDDSPLTIVADVLVLAVHKTDAGPRVLGEGDMTAVQSVLAAIGATGNQDELLRLPPLVGVCGGIALIGIGSEPLTPDSLRYASGSAARQLAGCASVVFGIPTQTSADLLAVLEGAVMGAYSFDEFRVSTVVTLKAPPGVITVASTVTGAAEQLAYAEAIGAAIHAARDLGNAPPSHLYPETFAERTTELAEGLPVQVMVLDVDDLVEGGYGGLLGVGLGSSRGPRLVKVDYHPAGANVHLALVGKGITFDTGGINLKSPVPMARMKYDMMGAASVLAVALAAARLKLPLRVTAWLCLAENMPSGTAGRPEDVLRIRGGKTVENMNTDAEGRLVLADGLVAAGEEHPDYIIDVATLTGAQSIALGTRYAGVMGDTDLVGEVMHCSREAGETMWPMPMPSELRALLTSDVADLTNLKPGSTAGGMLLGAIFLQEFVPVVGEKENAKRIPWAHLDIAGPADNNAAGYGYLGKGATGVSIRTLIRLAERLCRS